jgi:putative addiction module component (TIGR02574 family)
MAILDSDLDSIPLTDEQRRDLDRRIDELERYGPDGLSWEEVVREARA